MASSNVGLDLILLTKIINKLDVLYLKLSDIDTLLGKMEKRKVVFSFGPEFTKSANAVNRLTKSLSLLNTTTAKDISKFQGNVKGLSANLRSLAAAVSKKDFNAPGLRKFVATLKDLASVNFKSSGGGGAGIVTQLKKLLSDLSALKVPPNLDKKFDFTFLEKFVDSINKLTKLDTSASSSFATNISNLLDILETVLKKVSNLSATPLPAGIIKKVLTLRIVVSQIATTIKGITNVIKGVTPAQLSNLETILKDLFDIFDIFRSYGGNVPWKQILGDVIIFRLVLGQVVHLARGVVSVTKDVTSGQMDKLEIVLRTLFDVFDVFKGYTGTVPWKQILGDVIVFRLVLGQVVKVSRSILSVVKDVTPGQMEKLEEVLKTLFDVFNVFKDYNGKVAWKQILGDVIVFKLVLGRIAAAARSIVEVVKGVTKNNVDTLNSILSAMFDTFDEIKSYDSTVDWKVILKDVGQFGKVLGKVFSLVGGIVSVIKGVTAAQLSALGVILRAMFDIFEFFNTLGKGIIGLNFLKFISSFVKMTLLFSLIRVFIGTVISAAKAGTVPQIQAAASLLRGISQLFTSIAVLSKALDGISILKIIPIMIKMSLLFSVVKKMLRSLIELASGGSPESIRAIGQLFRAFGETLKWVQKFAVELKDISVVEAIKRAVKMRILFRAVEGTLTAMIKAAKGSSSGQISAVGDLMQGMGSVVESTAKLIDRMEGGLLSFGIKTVSFVKRIYKAIGGMVEVIVKVTKGVDESKLRAAGGLISSVGLVLEQSARIINDIPSNVFSGSATNMFKSVADIFSSIRKVAKQANDSDLEKMDRSIRLLRDLFSLIKNAFSIDVATILPSIKNVVEVLRSLTEGLDSIDVGRGFDKKLKALEQTVKVFEVLFDSLRGVSGSSGADVGTIVKAMSSVSKEMKTTAVSSDEVARGVLKAYSRIRLMTLGFNLVTLAAKSAFKIMRELSAINLLKRGISSLSNASQKLRDFSEDIRDVGENLRDLGESLIDTVGISKITESEFFTSAVDFDKVGRQLQVFGGLNEEARKQAEEFAFEIGKAYPLSANQALDATLDLIKAGQDLSSVEFILPSAADLAALSDSGSLEAATSTLIAAQAGFDSFSSTVEGTFENIATASNIISAAADTSTASVESLSAGLANVGPTANAAGLSLEETSAILAIFDNNAIRGAEGGTALRSLLNALGKPSTASAMARLQNRVSGMGEEFRNLNLAMFDTEGNRVPLNDLMNDLGTALDALPAAERQNYLQQLADTFGRQGLNILIGQGTDAIDNMVESISEVNPASQRAGELLDNFAGDVTQLQGSFETLMTKALVPLLETIFRPFVKLGRFVVDTLLSINDAVLEFISTGIALVSIMATIIGVFLIFSGGLIQIGGGILLATSYLVNFANVFAVFFGVISAGAVAILALVSAFAFLLPLVLAITAVFRTLSIVFSEDIGGASTSVKGFFSELAATLADLVGGLTSVIGLFVNLLALGGGAGNPLEAIGESISSFVDGLTASLNSGAIGSLRQGARDITGIVGAIWGTITKDTRKAKIEEEITDKLLSLGESAEGAAAAASRQIVGDATSVIRELVASNAIIRALVGDNVLEVSRFITGLAELALETIDVFGDIRDAFATFTKVFRVFGLSEAIRRLGSDLDDSFGDLLGIVLRGIQTVFGVNLDEEIRVATDEWAGGFSGSINLVFNRIVDNLKASAIANRGALRSVFTSLMRFFFSPLRAVGFFAKVFGLESLENFVSEVNSFLEKLFGGVFDVFFNLLEGSSFGEATQDAFGDGIAPILEFINQLGIAAELVFTILQKLFGVLFGGLIGEGSGSSISDFIGAIFTSLSESLANLSTLILEPLSRGDIFGAVENVIPLVLNLIVSLGNAILAVARALDVPQIFTDIGGAIANLLITGIRGGIEAIGNITGIDVSGVLATLDSTISANIDAIEAGGVGGVFTLIGSSIAGLFVASINGAFALIGSQLDIDTTAIQAALNEELGAVFTSLEEIFLGTDGASIFDNISTVLGTISSAISGIFDAFSGGDASEVEGTVGALELLLDFLGRLAILSLDALIGPLQALDEFIGFLAEQDAQQLSRIGLALVLVAAGVKALALAAALGGVSAMFTAISTFIGGITVAGIASAISLSGAINLLALSISKFAATAAGKLVGVIAILIIIKSLVSSVGELLEVFEAVGNLDLGKALEELLDAIIFFANEITFEVFGLLGFENLFGGKEENMENLREFGDLLLQVISLLISKIGNFIAQSFLSLALKTQGLAAELEALVGSDIFGAGGRGFLDLQDFFDQEEVSISDFVALSDREDVPEESLRRFAGVFADKLQAAFLAEFEGSTELSDELSAAFEAAIGAGQGEKILRGFLAADDVDTVQLLLENFGLDDPAKFANTIEEALARGVIDADTAISLLTELDLSIAEAAGPTARREILDQVNEILLELGAEPIEMPIPINPVIESDFLDLSEAAQQAAFTEQEIFALYGIVTPDSFLKVAAERFQLALDDNPDVNIGQLLIDGLESSLVNLPGFRDTGMVQTSIEALYESFVGTDVFPDTVDLEEFKIQLGDILIDEGVGQNRSEFVDAVVAFVRDGGIVELGDAAPVVVDNVVIAPNQVEVDTTESVVVPSATGGPDEAIHIGQVTLIPETVGVLPPEGGAATLPDEDIVIPVSSVTLVPAETVVEPETPVELFDEEFDFESAADAEALTLEVIELQTNLGLLQEEFVRITEASPQLIEDLTAIDLAMATLRATSSSWYLVMALGTAALGLAALLVWQVLIIPTLMQINALILDITANYNIMVLTVIENNLAFADALAGFAGVMIDGYRQVGSAVVDLQKALQATLGDAEALAAQMSRINGGDPANNPGVAAGNANGGVTLSGGLYNVTERGSEVLIEGGKMYLLSGGSGKVEPLKNVLPDLSYARQTGAFSSGLQGRSNSSTVNNSSSTSITEGDVFVTVMKPGASAQDIADAVVRSKRGEQQGSGISVRNQLRTTHR